MIFDAESKPWTTRFIDDPNYNAKQQHKFFKGQKQMKNMHTGKVEWM